MRKYMELKGKKVTVIGLGKSGLAAAFLLQDKGAVPIVTDSAKDEEPEKNARLLSEKSIRFELGGHTEEFMDDAELVVASPGVSDESPAIRWAAERGLPIISEIELAYNFCRAPIIAVTGTNGKSTVTTMIGEILKSDPSRRVAVCGNIGIPFSSCVSGLDENSVAVLEVSSFQLERIKRFRPKVSIFLNISQDHLDRYQDTEQYFDAKKKIFINQDESDFAVLNYDSPKIRSLGNSMKASPFYFSRHRMPRECDGAYLENGQLLIRRGKKFQWIAGWDELSLEGDHNLANYLASTAAGFIMGIKPDAIEEALLNFKALPHRFETVDVLNGVRFVDDSKATNVDSVVKALASCRSPVILLAGGRDKNMDFRALAKPVKEKVRHLILFGEARDKIASAVGSVKPIHFTETIEKAVELAKEKASRGDTVLLSPVCASFDMFRDYKERGEAFRKAVEKLK